MTNDELLSLLPNELASEFRQLLEMRELIRQKEQQGNDTTFDRIHYKQKLSECNAELKNAECGGQLRADVIEEIRDEIFTIGTP